MSAYALAAVMTVPGKTELREFPLPETGEDDGLLRVESCGVSDADPVLYRRGDLAPAVLGHEVFGIVERIGEAASAKWNLRTGDRVIIQEYLPCGTCKWCASGEYRLCPAAQSGAPSALRYGMTQMTIAPGLWGGFSQYLYLHPRSIAHAVPKDVSDKHASLVLPMSNAVQWACLESAGLEGKTVLVFGARFAGLLAVYVARSAGAENIILCGLTREKAHFELGMRLGADHMFAADADGLKEKIADATKGEGAEIVVDTTSDTSGRVAATAISVAATGATLVLGGIGMVPVNLGEVRRKYLTLKPVRGHSTAAVVTALDLLGRNPSDFEELISRSFSLEKTDAAIRAGDADIFPDILRAVVRPWK